MKTNSKIIKEYLKTHLSPERFSHTLATLKLAQALAKKHKTNLTNTSIASLLHDAGKQFDKAAMKAYAISHKVSVPNLKQTIKNNPALLHSFISAHIAKNVFGIKNTSVLNAIAFHTLGDPNMDTLAKIIYLADAASPDRSYKGVNAIRQTALINLDSALVMAQSIKIAHVLEKKAWLHPKALESWNAFVLTCGENKK